MKLKIKMMKKIVFLLFCALTLTGCQTSINDAKNECIYSKDSLKEKFNAIREEIYILFGTHVHEENKTYTMLLIYDEERVQTNLFGDCSFEKGYSCNESREEIDTRFKEYNLEIKRLFSNGRYQYEMNEVLKIIDKLYEERKFYGPNCWFD